MRTRESPVTGESALSQDGAAVYVYAVVRDDAAAAALPPETVGVAELPVRTTAWGGLAAVVSDVPADWRAAGRADLEAHDGLLRAMLERATVIPMRFGVVMTSEEEVRQRLLESHGAELDSLLSYLQGRVQMSIKAYYRDEALLREVLRRHPDLKRRSDALEGVALAVSQQDRIALGRDVAAAVEAQRALDEQAVVAAVADAADDIRVDAPVSDRQLATVQLLVDERRRPALDAAVQRLIEMQSERFAFRYVGPIAPYSFCDISLED